jgi:UDP-hydrolysing UDP-N-acetyl-D-glucosamine 2-epimerase
VRTIGAVTTSRADYSSLFPVLQAIDADFDLGLLLFVSGTHLSPEFGLTIDQIEADGFTVTDRINMQIRGDAPQEIGRSMGRGVIGFSDSFTKFRPDIILIVGDRFELLSVTCAALPLAIPVAHMSGGDMTIGAIDNQVRHAISKMSHIHYPDMEAHGRRLLQMGEEPSRVIVTGDPALDFIQQVQLLGRSELGEFLKLDLQPPVIVVSFHPTTLGSEGVESEVEALLSALSEIKGTQVFTYPNADVDNQKITRRVKEYVDSRPASGLFYSLGQTRYYSLLSIADVMVGNSSSGLFEAPSFHLPVVNIGERQDGRIREKNVIDAVAESEAIREAMQRSLEASFRESLNDLINPYGDGGSAPRIVDSLKKIILGPELLKKPFVDLEASFPEVPIAG